MAHPIEEFAIEAYMAGVTRAGGPVTQRVIAGASAALALAVEHADDPRVLEVTVDLGKLEGLWARLFQRREDLIWQHHRTVARAWREVLTADLITDAIRALRRANEEPSPQRWKQAVAAAAAALVAALRGRPQWTALRQALRDAVAAGQAEGAAAAAILTADRSGQQLPDWDAEYAVALDAVDGRYQLWGDADTWSNRLLDRATLHLTRAVGDDPDATDDDLAASADQALIDDQNGPVGFTVDWAITTAAAAGALAAYAAQGQKEAAWVTAGDGRVCALCETREAEGPYPLIEFPQLPAHPLCRCQAVPA